MAKKNFVFIYFGLLFILLLYIYFPTFSHPFRSDYWTAAYFFHEVDNLGWQKWLHIFQYDPWTQVRFQPLAISILYFVWSVFGVNFISFHILNFCLYYISLLLLYRLAINFCKSRALIIAFLTVFAFLFSHFDIICWAYHAYIIFGFNCFLLGFILYINFLKSNKKALLPPVVSLFLLGMLCYESFFLWPLALIILNYIERIKEKQKFKKNELLFSSLLVNGLVYFLYISFFLSVRFFRFGHQPLIDLSQLFSASGIIFSTFAVFFNIFYNGLLINIIPFLVCPLKIGSNLDMKFLPQEYSHLLPYFITGAILFIFLRRVFSLYRQKNFKALRKNIYFVLFLFLLFFTAVTLCPSLFKYHFSYDLKLNILILSLIIICVFLRTIKYLWERRHSQLLKIAIFFLFLLCSESFILFHCRSITNPSVYIITQFRYGYISNAFLILTILFLIDNYLKSSRRGKAIIYSTLCLILMVNINTTKKYGISVLNSHLAPLKKLFSNIKVSIRDGQIDKENRLYIDDGIVKALPSLCWNRAMGEQFIKKGTYQWAFSKKEIDYFSFVRKDAKWVIDKETLNIISREEAKE